MLFQGCCLLRVRRGCILIIFQRMTTRLKKVKNTSMDPTGYKNPLAMNKYTFSLNNSLLLLEIQQSRWRWRCYLLLCCGLQKSLVARLLPRCLRWTLEQCLHRLWREGLDLVGLPREWLVATREYIGWTLRCEWALRASSEECAYTQNRGGKTSWRRWLI